MTGTPRPALPAAFLSAPIAHRAYHDRDNRRPENSRAAIHAAMAAGYGIEIDLQLSSDGAAMVFHDDDLDRLTGESGPVRSRTGAELGTITLTGSDEGIPGLREVLELVDGQVPLLVEIKDQHGAMGPTDGALERATAKELATYPGPVAVMSFNPAAVAWMARLAPGLPRGWVTCSYKASDWPNVPGSLLHQLRAMDGFGAQGEAFISHEMADLGSAQVGAVKARGLPVLCWTVRSSAAEVRAREIADNITFEGYAARLPS